MCKWEEFCSWIPLVDYHPESFSKVGCEEGLPKNFLLDCRLLFKPCMFMQHFCFRILDALRPSSLFLHSTSEQ